MQVEIFSPEAQRKDTHPRHEKRFLIENFCLLPSIKATSIPSISFQNQIFSF
jgi:hypothetical protein